MIGDYIAPSYTVWNDFCNEYKTYTILCTIKGSHVFRETRQAYRLDQANAYKEPRLM